MVRSVGIPACRQALPTRASPSINEGATVRFSPPRPPLYKSSYRKDTESHSLHPVNRIDHKRWVDHSRDSDEEISV